MARETATIVWRSRTSGEIVERATRDLYRARLDASGRTIRVGLRIRPRKVGRRDFGICERMRRDDCDFNERNIRDRTAYRRAAAARAKATACVAVIVTARHRLMRLLIAVIRRRLRVRCVRRTHVVHVRATARDGSGGSAVVHGTRVQTADLRESSGEPKSPDPDKGPKPKRTAHGRTIHPDREKFTSGCLTTCQANC